MRRSTVRRRRWNNMMIFGCIAFIVVLNMPTLIKTYLLEQTDSPSVTPYLLNPLADLQAMYFPNMSLINKEQGWVLSQSSSMDGQELAERWQGLVGTLVDDAMFERLQPQLSSPTTIEVWYLGKQSPHKVILYQTPNFWLMRSWDDKWLAISVAGEYLLP